MTQQLWKVYRSLQLGRGIWQELDESVRADSEIEAARAAFDLIKEGMPSLAEDKQNPLILRLLRVEENDPNLEWDLETLAKWERRRYLEELLDILPRIATLRQRLKSMHAYSFDEKRLAAFEEREQVLRKLLEPLKVYEQSEIDYLKTRYKNMAEGSS